MLLRVLTSLSLKSAMAGAFIPQTRAPSASLHRRAARPLLLGSLVRSECGSQCQNDSDALEEK